MEKNKVKQTKNPTFQEIQNDKNRLFPSSPWLSKNGQQIQGSGGWGVLSLYAARKKFSEHFVGKKSLAQETRINRDCNNPCYRWDGPSLHPSCIIGNPPREAFWTKRFSRAWCTNFVTKFTGSCLQCSINIFYRRPENFHAWSRTESPDAKQSCSSPGLTAGPILTQPAAQGDITCEIWSLRLKCLVLSHFACQHYPFTLVRASHLPEN